jgi:hypothetical protein
MERRTRTITIAIAISTVVGCGGGGSGGPDAGTCGPFGVVCAEGEVCRYDTCVPTPTPCTTDAECTGDRYCDETTLECLPWGTGPGGINDPTCVRDPVPGVFFPGAQCEWLGPPAGDPFPEHKNVLGTPMVAVYDSSDETIRPWIVFVAYNYTDGGLQSCASSEPASYYGVIRVIDGRSCNQITTLSAPTVVGSASVALGDIGGPDTKPEIIAARSDGGLVAWTLHPVDGWQVLWQTASTYGDAFCNWGGPSIHDLDADGRPEILFYGAIYDNLGNALDETLDPLVLDPAGTGYIPVVADVDADGLPELVSGAQTYAFDTALRRWIPEAAIGGQSGRTAVADLGTYPADPLMDNRGALDGVGEIVTVHAGIIHAYNLSGRQVFTATLAGTGNGGPPTIADFDGDGRAELASANGTAYSVFDLDCQGTPDPQFCFSARADGILWSQPSQDGSSNVTGSSVFDFEGDGRAEAVYGDECFTRVYDGLTGQVLYSRYRRSCTWYENPIVADVDGDFNAEIVSTSNTNCPGITCPVLDPIFDGIQCLDQSDCPGTTTCVREQPNDVNGLCRCAADADCGGDGYVCRDRIAGPSPMGQVCRAENPGPSTAFGVRVLSDSLDRWVNTRTIWNQHAYAVTNVNDDGTIPSGVSWLRNWTVSGLNNFRQNSPGDGQGATRIPDLTIRQVKAVCNGANPSIVAEVCNRGTEPVADGLEIAAYGPGPALACVMTTTSILLAGQCVTVNCSWPNGMGDVTVVVDDHGDGSSQNLECREDNNTATLVDVHCP